MDNLKYDHEKVRVDLVPPEFIYATARVLGFGATKYSENGWREGIEYKRLYAALLRHILAWGEGEDLDPESGENHLAHAACNLAFLLTFIKENRTHLDFQRNHNGSE